MKKWFSLLVVIVACAVVVPASAQDNKFKVYGAFNWVTPTTDEKINSDTIEASDEAGWSVGFEWRFGKWAGLEFDYLMADQDIEENSVAIGDTTMSPLSGSFNFHLVHTKYVDFYFGPTVSYVMWDDIEDSMGGKTKVDDEFAYGAQVGLDISLIKSLAIVVGVRYLKLDITDSDTNTSVGVDPLYSKVGLAFRW